jgi:hypothetical protein
VCREVSAFLGKCKVVHKEVGQVFPVAPRGIHRSTQEELTSGYKRRLMSVQGVTMRRCQQEEFYKPKSLDDLDLDLNYNQKTTR